MSQNLNNFSTYKVFLKKFLLENYRNFETKSFWESNIETIQPRAS